MGAARTWDRQRALRVARLFLALGVLTLLLACRRGGGPPPPQLPPPPTPMPAPVPLYYDNGGGIRDSVRILARDQATLTTFWRQATSTQASPPALPAVDFSREMVIIVSTGRKTPEEQIHVDSLLVRRVTLATGDREETLTIVVRTVIGCGRMRTDAYPVEIVRARKFDGPINWDERKAQTNCQGPPLPES